MRFASPTTWAGCCLTILFLQVSLLAAPSAEQLKTEAARGDTEAIIALADAYFHGSTRGIPQDFRQARIWATVYMELVPNFPRGVERVAIFSGQELEARGEFTLEDSNRLNDEAQRLLRQVKASRSQTRAGASPSTGEGEATQLTYHGTFLGIEPSHFSAAGGRLNLLSMRVNGADVVDLVLLGNDRNEETLLRNTRKYLGKECLIKVRMRRVAMLNGEDADVRAVEGIKWLE